MRVLPALVPLAALAAATLWWRLEAPNDRDRLDVPAPVIDGGDALLVDLADDLSEAERAALVALLPAGSALNSVWSADEQTWRVPAEQVTDALVDSLARDPRVEHLEEDGVYTYTDLGPLRPAPLIPDDPLYPFQWHFEQIGLEDAWLNARGDGVVVAVIDTGVSAADVPARGVRGVRDLAGTAFVPGYDFVADSPDASDLHGHGTHVAGTIAQTTNNGYGVAGIAPRAKIMPLRVLDAQGRGSTADIADAIRFAARNGAHVINLSLGGPLPSRVLSDAVQYARSRGVVVVAAAGNSGSDRPGYPAAYDGVIAVAATQYDRTATFYSNWGRHIDIAAPGGNVRVDQNDDGRPDGVLQETLARGDASQHEFALYMGTSMASPHVAGVAALVRSTGVTDVDRIEEILLRSADASGPASDRLHYGAGILDAAAATTASVSGDAAPRVAWGLLLPLVLLGFAPPQSRRGVSLATMVGASVGVLVALPMLVGAVAWLGAPGPLVAGSLQLVRGATSNLLVSSAMPAVALYALFGSVRAPGARGALVGAITGFAAMLALTALAPARDVWGVPGQGALDAVWVALGALMSLAVAATALRPAR